MCMEDVRLNRKTSSANSDAATTVASALAIPQNEKRTALVISNTGANPVYLSLVSPAADSKGIKLPANGDPLVLDLFHHGRMVTSSWYAISPAGASNVGFTESVLQEE